MGDRRKQQRNARRPQADRLDFDVDVGKREEEASPELQREVRQYSRRLRRQLHRGVVRVRILQAHGKGPVWPIADQSHSDNFTNRVLGSVLTDWETPRESAVMADAWSEVSEKTQGKVKGAGGENSYCYDRIPPELVRAPASGGPRYGSRPA